MRERHITKVGLVVLREGELLCVRKSPEHKWILPGGKPEAHETDVETLERELAEELCCGLRGHLQWLGAFQDRAADEHRTIVIVRAWLGEVDRDPHPDMEITEVRWLPLASRSDDLAPSLRRQVLPRLSELVTTQ